MPVDSKVDFEWLSQEVLDLFETKGYKPATRRQ